MASAKTTAARAARASAAGATAGGAGQAAGLAHARLAHGPARAVELAERPLDGERARSPEADARRARVPGKHAVLRGCGLHRLRGVEGGDRPRASDSHSRRRQRDAASQAGLLRARARRDRVLLAVGGRPPEATGADAAG